MTVGGVVAGAVLIVVVVATFESPSGSVGERDPAVVTEGASLFAASCAVCHGQSLNGTLTGPPMLVPTYAPNHHADEAFQRAVAFGVQPHHWDFGPMAPVAGLSRSDVEKITAFVRTEQEAAGIFRDPSHP